MQGYRTLAVIATIVALPAQELPPVPAPEENPTTPEKAVLGKALFWEEQLSSDDSMACGTCHRPASGGGDPRSRRQPGLDERMLTDDDVFGSPGMPRPHTGEQSILDDLFDRSSHVSSRTAPSYLTAQFAPDLFWDGRARGEFRDPLTDEVVIASGGALESQALVPIMGVKEMSHAGRTWADVVAKLAAAEPLKLASKLPPDLARAISARPTYPELFAAAFGDKSITPTRIAFAIASYERTLLPDQTPYDRFVAGDRTAMTASQQQGFRYFRQFRCASCHTPPMFTDHSFRNIGVRPQREDYGRHGVTGKKGDRGRFKVPSLRNVGLRPRLMHNGRFSTIPQAMRIYRWPRRDSNLDRLLGRRNMNADTRSDKTPLADFLRNALTDPRVAAETYPFDRPVLGSERE